MKTRRIKRIVAAVLFSGTLGLALYAKERKRNKLKEYLEGCQRLPVDDDFSSTVGSELFRYKGCIFPGTMIKSGTLKQLETFTINRDDVIVSSFPKSGTTWVQEIVYLIETGLNFEEASKQVMENRFPYLEYPYPGLTTLKQKPSPRMLKTHLPFSLLPKSAIENGTKIIYIVRNPKDVAVSYFHFLRMASFVSYKGSWRDFAAKFLKGEVPYGPYFSHVLDYWEQYQSNPDGNILWLSYEQMHKDPEGAIRKIAQFLDRPLSDDQVRLIAQHTHFDQMSRNPSVNYSHWDDLGLRNKNEAPFMRKGRVGDWQRYFGAELELDSAFNRWILENTAGNKIRFDYLPEPNVDNP